MKISKISSVIAAAAMAVSMMAVNASATNWANASYADENPDTVKIISTDENSVSFTATADGAQVKCRVTVGDLLENPEAVKSASWDVTYTIPEGTPAGNGVGGATWFGCKNSTDYWISPEYDEDGNAYWAETTYSATCEVKFLLPTEVLNADSELVFMEWSSHEAITSMTMTVSNIKFFDADGNELAQKPYGGAAAAEPTTEAPAATEDTAPAADNNTSAAATGNVPAAVMASVMAVAGAAAVVSRKRK